MRTGSLSDLGLIYRNGVGSSDLRADVELPAGDALVIDGQPDDRQASAIEIIAGL